MMSGMEPDIVFCTSFIRNEAEWRSRYLRWIEHHRKVFPNAALVLIDDGSPFLPSEDGIAVNTEFTKSAGFGPRATIFRFPDNLGRHSVTNFPGWFRSFTASSLVADIRQAKKMIHVESDALILKHRAKNHLEDIQSGWVAFWCPRWSFPESGLQVICSDQFSALENIRKANYDEVYSNLYMENSLPFTSVDRNLHGNRYGEFRTKVPSYADFAMQVTDEVRYTSEF